MKKIFSIMIVITALALSGCGLKASNQISQNKNSTSAQVEKNTTNQATQNNQSNLGYTPFKFSSCDQIMTVDEFRKITGLTDITFERTNLNNSEQGREYIFCELRLGDVHDMQISVGGSYTSNSYYPVKSTFYNKDSKNLDFVKSGFMNTSSNRMVAFIEDTNQYYVNIIAVVSRLTNEQIIEIARQISENIK